MRRKLISGLLSLAVIVIIFTSLDEVFGFIVWLLKINNADFGFPRWADILISTIGGIIAYWFIGTIAGFINFYDKSAMSLGKNIASIIFGFVIGFVIHIFLRYWYVILAILVLLLVVIVLIFIRNKIVQRNN